MESMGPIHLSLQGANPSAIPVSTTKYGTSRAGLRSAASTRLLNSVKSVNLSTNWSLPSANQSLSSANQSLSSANQSLPSTKQSLSSANQSLTSAYWCLSSAYQCLPSAESGLPRDYLVDEKLPPALGGWEDFQDLSAYCVKDNSQPSAMDKFTEGSAFHIEDELNTPDVVDVIDRFNFNHAVCGGNIPMLDDWGLAPLAPFPLSMDMNELCPLDGVLGGPNTEGELVFVGDTTNGGLEKEPQHMVETIRFSTDEWGLNLEGEQVVMGDYMVEGGSTTAVPECGSSHVQQEQLMDIHIEQFINANPVEDNSTSVNYIVYEEQTIGVDASMEQALITENKGTTRKRKQTTSASTRKVKNNAAGKSRAKRLKKDTATKKSRGKPTNYKEVMIKMEPMTMQLDPIQEMVLAEDIDVGSEEEIVSTEVVKLEESNFPNPEVDVGGLGLRLDLPKLSDILNLEDGACISTPEVTKSLEADPEFDLLAYVFDNNKTNKLSLDTVDSSFFGPEVIFSEGLETDSQLVRVLPMIQPKSVKLVGAQTTVAPAAPGLPLINVNLIGTGVKTISEFRGKRRPSVLKKSNNKPISGEEDDGDDEGESVSVITVEEDGPSTAAATISSLLLNAAKGSRISKSPSTSRTSTSLSPPVAKRSSVRKRDKKHSADYDWFERSTSRNAKKPQVVHSSSDESSSTSSKRPCPSSNEETGPVCYRYRQLRSKNNEASRRSRLNRKMRDRELNDSASIMVRDNVELKAKAEELERLVKRMREALLQAVLDAKKSKV